LRCERCIEVEHHAPELWIIARLPQERCHGFEIATRYCAVELVEHFFVRSTLLFGIKHALPPEVA
jgi:hypothetical protein